MGASSLKTVLRKNWLNIGLGAYSGVSSYNEARQQGQSNLGAIAKGVADGALIDIIGWKLYFGGAALISAPKMAVGAYENLAQKSRSMEMSNHAPFIGNSFVDTEQTYTMRQAGMQMAEQSQFNTKRALLGNEAQYLHR